MKKKRGAQRQSECVFLGVWVPVSMGTAIDEAVKMVDTDRSKFVRTAIKEKLSGRAA